MGKDKPKVNDVKIQHLTIEEYSALRFVLNGVYGFPGKPILMPEVYKEMVKEKTLTIVKKSN